MNNGDATVERPSQAPTDGQASDDFGLDVEPETDAAAHSAPTADPAPSAAPEGAADMAKTKTGARGRKGAAKTAKTAKAAKRAPRAAKAAKAAKTPRAAGTPRAARGSSNGTLPSADKLGRIVEIKMIDGNRYANLVFDSGYVLRVFPVNVPFPADAARRASQVLVDVLKRHIQTA